MGNLVIVGVAKLSLYSCTASNFEVPWYSRDSGGGGEADM